MEKKIKEKAKAIELRKLGWSIKEIASELFISKSSVSNYTKGIELTEKQVFRLKKKQVDNALKTVAKRKVGRSDEVLKHSVNTETTEAPTRILNGPLSGCQQKHIGDISEAKILASLVGRGEVVLLPFGDNQRYDLVIDRFNTFFRVQIKTGKILKSGSVQFYTCSSYAHRGRGKRDYIGDADYFGIYCPQNNKCYLLPVSSAGKRAGTLTSKKLPNRLFTGDFEI